MINITFESQALHDICANLEMAEQQYGSVSAGALVTFLSDARSLETADELIELLGNDVTISANDTISVVIGVGYRANLIVVGTHHSRDPTGRIVWVSVTRLKLISILRAP